MMDVIRYTSSRDGRGFLAVSDENINLEANTFRSEMFRDLEKGRAKATKEQRGFLF